MKDMKQWAKDYPIGKEVNYQSIIVGAPLKLCEIKTAPWELSPGNWLVKVSGQSGGVSIDHVSERTEPELTKNQIDVGAHTIGLSNGEKRNFFGAGSKGKDREDLDILEGYGYAFSFKGPSWSGDDRIFNLTDEGKEAITKAYKRREMMKGLKKHNPDSSNETLEWLADNLEKQRS